jgi:hypothetical protein
MPTALLLTTLTPEKEAFFLKRLIQNQVVMCLPLDIATGMSMKGAADLSCHPSAAEIGPESEGSPSADGKYILPRVMWSQAGLKIARKLFLEGRINGMASKAGQAILPSPPLS